MGSPLVALQGETLIAAGEAARRLLDTPASADLAPIARERFVAQARADLPRLLEGPVAEHVRDRANALSQDHARLRVATGSGAGAAARVSVKAVTPPDVIGLFVLLPSER